jgi:hypothetical protein
MINFFVKNKINIYLLILIVQTFSYLLFTNPFVSYRYIFFLNSLLLVIFLYINNFINKNNIYLLFINFFFLISFKNFNNYTILNLFFLNILLLWNGGQVKINYKKSYLHYYCVFFIICLALFFYLVPSVEIGYFRYTIFSLDVNTFAIICLSILSCLFYSKKYNIKLLHIYFSILVVLYTQSRIALIYIVIEYFILFTRLVNFKRFFIFFIILFIILMSASYVFVTIIPSLDLLENNLFFSGSFIDKFPRLLYPFDFSMVYKFYSNYHFLEFLINNFNKFILIPDIQAIFNDLPEDQSRSLHPHNSILGIIKTMGIFYFIILFYLLFKHLKNNLTFLHLLIPSIISGLFLGATFVALLNIFILRSSLFIKNLENEDKQKK